MTAATLPAEAMMAVDKDDGLHLADLIKRGLVGVNDVSTLQETMLIRAATYRLNDVCRVLIINHADLEVTGRYDKTALHFAVENNNFRGVEMLLEAGANVDCVNAQHETPIFIACKSRHFSLVPSILKAGADPDIRDFYARTPLMLAASFGDTHICKQLIEAGADGSLVDAINRTAIEIAVENGFHEAAADMVAAFAARDARPLQKVRVRMGGL